MSQLVVLPELTTIPTSRQRSFLRYFTATLIDLVVLGLFAEFWGRVHIESFSILLLAAVLLQVMLKATLILEHKLGGRIESKAARLLTAWLLLVVSKFAILYALELAFGERVHFEGAMHGVVPFIVVVMAMLAAEVLILKFYWSLGEEGEGAPGHVG